MASHRRTAADKAVARTPQELRDFDQSLTVLQLLLAGRFQGVDSTGRRNTPPLCSGTLEWHAYGGTRTDMVRAELEAAR